VAPDYIPCDIDVTTANVARIYDYFLGGKDNFAVDREAAHQITAMMPQVPAVARENRAFMRRAVRVLAADYGIRQFIDLGAGLPTRQCVHSIASEFAPDAHVVYVDNDPVVCSHGRALLEGHASTMVEADLRQPGEVIGHPLTTSLIDFAEPCALLLTAVLHFVPDEDDPRAIIARYRDAMAPGSCLVISHGTHESPSGRDDERARRSADVYRRASATLALRSLDEVRCLFDGFEMIDPGLVWISQWRRDLNERYEGPAQSMRGGIGRLPDPGED
jgi:O-methyltransferase involved in polyketide biosynthesis